MLLPVDTGMTAVLASNFPPGDGRLADLYAVLSVFLI